jgi:hypothetical protein
VIPLLLFIGQQEPHLIREVGKSIAVNE